MLGDASSTATTSRCGGGRGQCSGAEIEQAIVAGLYARTPKAGRWIPNC